MKEKGSRFDTLLGNMATGKESQLNQKWSHFARALPWSTSGTLSASLKHCGTW